METPRKSDSELVLSKDNVSVKFKMLLTNTVHDVFVWSCRSTGENQNSDKEYVL